MKAITFHCYDENHGLDADGNDVVEQTRFDVVSELRDDGTVLVCNPVHGDDVWDSPEDFQPCGLAVCEGWEVES